MPSCLRSAIRASGRLRAPAIFLVAVLSLSAPREVAAQQQCRDWIVTIGVDSASGPLSSLQLFIDYSQSGGVFAGSGGDVECQGLPSNSLFSANDSERTRALRMGIVRLQPFAVPDDFVECRFRMHSTNALTAAALPVVVEQAANLYEELTASVTLRIEADGPAEACEPWCGDGSTGAGEECDDANLSNDDDCLNDCRVPFCGDGVVRQGEQCDDFFPGNFDGCLDSCELASCGDGFIHGGVEQCEDGNDDNTDHCTGSCRFAVCGDGYRYVGVEECDDGDEDEGDRCPSTCERARCGDGFVRRLNEECDDANTIDTDSCRASCDFARCGDGIVHLGFEQCDDGNTTGGDTCLAGCRPPSCGNGVVDSPDEQCDDGNSAYWDGCSSACLRPVCGDGVVHPTMEQCDDANTSDADSCNSGCGHARCGDGFVREGVETCDDGNQEDGDGCAAGCGVLFVCGDVSGDGRVLASDAMRVLQRAIGQDVECPTWAADADGDQRVLTSDSLRVLRMAVGQLVLQACREPTAIRVLASAAETVAHLVVEVDLAGSGAELVSAGTEVACSPLVDGMSVSVESLPDEVIRVTVVSASGFGPARSLAECAIVPSGSLKARTFAASVVVAKTPDGTEVPGVDARSSLY